VITHVADVVPLSVTLKERRQRRPHVALTFDDGYGDNIDAARLLSARGLPATYFVVAGNVLSGREFWWDELERIVIESESLPPVLDLTVAETRLQMEIAPEARQRVAPARGRTWRVIHAPETERQRLYLELYRALRDLDPVERDDALARLASWAAAPRATRRSMRVLAADEVAAIASYEGAEIGGHTMTHPVLSFLSAERQRREVVDGKRCLEEIVGRDLESFAYPHGGPSHYTPETMQITSASGFRRACAAVGGAVVTPVDPLQVPRVMVDDWDAAELERRLHQLFDDRDGPSAHA
jgi:peptidoglycan/xylan/chitin deacetylase (PgdA/CDA1 family)